MDEVGDNRSGGFDITKFHKANFSSTGGLSFGDQMNEPGNLSQGASKYTSNSFCGPITGNNLPSNIGAFSGTARGSFVNRGADPTRGVIGNWNVGNNRYKATGIFAGSGIPGVVPK